MNQDDQGWYQTGSLRQQNGRIGVGEAHHTDRFDDRNVQLRNLPSAQVQSYTAGRFTSTRDESGWGFDKYLLALSITGRSTRLFL